MCSPYTSHSRIYRKHSIIRTKFVYFRFRHHIFGVNIYVTFIFRVGANPLLLRRIF